MHLHSADQGSRMQLRRHGISGEGEQVCQEFDASYNNGRRVVKTLGFKLWRWAGRKCGWYDPWNAIPKEQAFINKPPACDPAIFGNVLFTVKGEFTADDVWTGKYWTGKYKTSKVIPPFPEFLNDEAKKYPKESLSKESLEHGREIGD